MKNIKNIFLIIIVASTFVFCNYSSDQEIMLDESFNEGEVVNDNDLYAKTRNLATYRKSESTLDDNQVQQKIIKHGNISFETSDLEKTTTQIYELVKKHKAQIQSDTEGKNYQASYYKNILIRIDNDKFESFIEEISKGVNYFDNKEISSQDVTEQYIDIQTRIKNKKELENRYLELLKKATKVSEMIDIEKNISTIREEIEIQQGRLNYLQNQTSQSTLRVYFYKKTSDTGITNSFGYKIVSAFKHGFDGIASLFITFIEYWHIIIIFIICGWYYKKRKQNKKNENPS